MKDKKKASNKFINFKALGMLVALIVIMSIAISGCNGITGGSISEPDNGEGTDTRSEMYKFNECLAENGMVVYGMEWCPACNNLVEALGGYEDAEPVYVECTHAENQQRCQNEMKGNAVPEIQLNGEGYQGQRTLQGFSEATGCPLPQV